MITKEHWNHTHFFVSESEPCLNFSRACQDYKLGREDPQEKDLASTFLRSLGDLKAKSAYKCTFKSMNERTFYLALSSPAFKECLCVCLVAQLCPTLCNLMDYSLPGFSVHGIFQARIPEWVTISYCRVSSQHREQIRVSGVFCIGRQIFTSVPPGKPRIFMLLLCGC